MKEDRPPAKALRDLKPNNELIEEAVSAHPIGTSVGAAGGIAAGAAVGAVGGPVGSLVGAAVGAVAGALAGSGVADWVDPSAEDRHWQGAYSSRPYVPSGASYDDYGPAYRYGVGAYAQYNGRDWDDVEADLGSRWDHQRAGSSLAWNDARHAARDAWQRLSDGFERATPGDADRDGR